MLTITVPSTELYDERTNSFIEVKGRTIQLEHSLKSISKWEAKWHKPFISKTPMTQKEMVDYVRCMTLTQNVEPELYLALTAENYKDINQYIEDPMTATTFNRRNKTGANREIITSELIYYWMVAYGIPCEYEKWHLSRLLVLIEICGIKNAPSKKMSRKDIARQNAAINAARRKASGSSG